MVAAPEVEAPVPLALEGTIAPDDEHSRAGLVFSEAELDDLLAPLALYPDPLVALILPASNSPSDIVLASRFLAATPKATTFDEQPWDDAVRSLARYPEVIKWMDENLSWTRTLGEAFASQPVDVMNAIQRLRAKAQASGVLATNSQQTVVKEEEEIRIVPTETEVIYIPRYDPAIVFVDRPYSYYYGPLISFSIGFPLGYWAAYDFDWRHRRIYVVNHEHRVRVWNECREYRRPLYLARSEHRHIGDWTVWRAKYSSASPRAHPHHFNGRAGPSRDYSNRRATVSTAAVNSSISSTAGTPGVDRVRSSDRPGESRYRAPRSQAEATRDWRQRQPTSSAPVGGNVTDARRTVREAQIPQAGDSNFVGPVSARDRERATHGGTYRRSGPSEASRSQTSPPSLSTDRFTRGATETRVRPDAPRSDHTRRFTPPSSRPAVPAASNSTVRSAPSVRTAPPARSSPPVHAAPSVRSTPPSRSTSSSHSAPSARSAPPPATMRSSSSERSSYQSRAESSQSYSRRSSDSSSTPWRGGGGRSNSE